MIFWSEVYMAIISVIVPVYRVEKYLKRCVDSILAQTYRDFELILVDDGSPDYCGTICEEYAKKDRRIVVLHRENGGLSAARNTGIAWAFENSDSKYLTFIDSDDWIHPQYLELLFQAVDEKLVSVSVCNFERSDGLGEGVPECVADFSFEQMDAETLLVDHVWNFNYAWGKLYQKQYFQEVRYPEGKNFEDTFTTYKLLFAAKQIVLIDKPLYFYFKNENGITRSPWTPKELVVFEAMKDQLFFYRKNGYMHALEKEEYLYVNHFAYQICRIRENKAELKQNRVYLRRLRREMMKLIHQNPDRFGYRKMPQCYEAAFPGLMKIYHQVGGVIHKIL